MALRWEVPRFLNSPGRFESVFEDRQVDLSDINEEETENDIWLRQARNLALADWFAGAKSGLKVQDASMWLGLAARWGRNIAKMELESESFEPTLRFPLAAGVDTEVQLTGWVRWLESKMDLKRRAYSFMITGELESNAGLLSVVARDLAAEDFLLVTGVKKGLSYVDDLSEVSIDNADAGPAGGPAPVSPAEPGGSWADFAESAAPVA
jgi:hypothetical protein